RVRGFKPARTLYLIAAKNLRIGHDYKFCLIRNKSSSERTKMHRRRCIAAFFISILLNLRSWRRARTVQTEFFPDLQKALLLSVVIAKDMNGIVLSKPAMQLRKKFSALDFSDLRLKRTFCQWPMRIEAGEVQSEGIVCSLRLPGLG